MRNPTVSYRVEQNPETQRFDLYFIKADGFEYFFDDYESEVTARYLGIRGSQPAPTTDDGWRARRRQMRAI